MIPNPCPSLKTKTTNKKQKIRKISNYQQMVLYCLGLRTQNPGLREVDLQSRPRRGTDKVNMLQPRRKNITRNKLYLTTWTH